jgi:hypothetical protein
MLAVYDNISGMANRAIISIIPKVFVRKLHYKYTNYIPNGNLMAMEKQKKCKVGYYASFMPSGPSDSGSDMGSGTYGRIGETR